MGEHIKLQVAAQYNFRVKAVHSLRPEGGHGASAGCSVFSSSARANPS